MTTVVVDTVWIIGELSPVETGKFPDLSMIQGTIKKYNVKESTETTCKVEVTYE